MVITTKEDMCVLGVGVHEEYCFTLLSAQSWQYRDRRKPETETIPYSYFE